MSTEPHLTDPGTLALQVPRTNIFARPAATANGPGAGDLGGGSADRADPGSPAPRRAVTRVRALTAVAAAVAAAAVLAVPVLDGGSEPSTRAQLHGVRIPPLALPRTTPVTHRSAATQPRRRVRHRRERRREIPRRPRARRPQRHAPPLPVPPARPLASQPSQRRPELEAAPAVPARPTPAPSRPKRPVPAGVPDGSPPEFL